MVAEFNEACFSANKGDLTVVNSQFGTHLIEVTDQSSKSKKYKVAYLDRMVEYSNATYQKAFASAGKFAAENSNYDEFNESASNQNLTKRLADGLLANTINIPGLERGVCMVNVDKVISSPSSSDFSGAKNSLISNLQSRSSFQVYQALLELADVQDNRANFY